MSNKPLIFGLLTVVFAMQSSFAASVKSMGRAVSIKSNGQVMQQRTISCSDKQTRKIFKQEGARQWCLELGSVSCFRDKLVAAKKACQAKPVTELEVKKASSIIEKQPVEVKKAQKVEPITTQKPKPAASSSISKANRKLTGVQRQQLQSELEQINVERQKIRAKLEQIEAQSSELLNDKESPF